MHRRGFIIKRPRFSVGGNSFVDQDESSNHSSVNVLDYDEDSLSQLMTDRPRRVARPQGKPQQDDRTNLNPCLDYLLRNLSRKDKEGFFQFPVTDQVKRSKFISNLFYLLFSVGTGLFTNYSSTDGFFDDEKENYA